MFQQQDIFSSMPFQWQDKCFHLKLKEGMLLSPNLEAPHDPRPAAHHQANQSCINCLLFNDSNVVNFHCLSVVRKGSNLPFDEVMEAFRPWRFWSFQLLIAKWNRVALSMLTSLLCYGSFDDVHQSPIRMTLGWHSGSVGLNHSNKMEQRDWRSCASALIHPLHSSLCTCFEALSSSVNICKSPFSVMTAYWL